MPRRFIGTHDFSDEPEGSYGGLWPRVHFAPNCRDLLIEHARIVHYKYSAQMIPVDVQQLFEERTR